MPTNTNQIILNIRFKVKPGKKETFRDSLFSMINNFRNEPTFVNAIVSDDLDNPNDLVIYEIWQGTRESWIQDELPKPYRSEYEGALTSLIDDRIVSWLEPIGEWGSKLTSVTC
ncbi:putative quinol monooxygenase [Paenibacillus macerans]|uniref:Antibiotic biosynthesis monooxygenase family protein n=1 Tax=Paenibacillus macerans TaxID=44252 RepID=A0A090ZF59_PAEMA|nr:antibiotic biosynthesis monooxygenase [Paenibacillus macerans]KFN08870.1 antibiotic biosynthesis monooxygenase family protein [Paenibacillus macerans]MCY7562814.1 antibiotic biosynthesis monooxygenase [Paenibacillus macerans]MEC0154406.1 antibiotic biosynthesis monooxygenase [Paenibacillus macerans]MED4953858.1 antibiotic biosynthesis monooxygenase [Paenibacillus macerans]SUA83314.1 Antibiotic biosynthesis monooxygenase [Paenibacillus macerans]